MLLKSVAVLVLTAEYNVIVPRSCKHKAVDDKGREIFKINSIGVSRSKCFDEWLRRLESENL